MIQTQSSRLSGRTAIVTGAGSNIGKAIAIGLACEGAETMVVGRTKVHLDATVAEIEERGGRAFAVLVDVTSPEDVSNAVAKAVSRWGHIDILVNNAGIFTEPSFSELAVEDYRTTFDTNFLGPLLMSQEVARPMAKAGSGSIIHISSIDALGADGDLNLYPASKAAVLSLARTMSVELASKGIRVNCVSPGYVHTDLTHKIMSQDVIDHMLGDFTRVPLRRSLEPEEIAATVTFLASDSASGITGANIVVDGGLTANLFVPETLPSSGGDSNVP